MAEPIAVALPGAGVTHLGIVAGLAMGPAVGLGLGRFAYALLLPAMRADLGWSYAMAGIRRKVAGCFDCNRQLPDHGIPEQAVECEIDGSPRFKAIANQRTRFDDVGDPFGITPHRRRGLRVRRALSREASSTSL